MLTRSLWLSALLAAGVGAHAVADSAPAAEQPLESKLVSVGLFKNGIALLRREATIEGPGAFRLGQAPDPIHGTFWVESSADLETQVLARDVEVPFEESGVVDLEGDLVGKTVTLHFYQEKMPPLRGTVVERKRSRVAVEGGDTPDDPRRGPMPRPTDEFLIVENAGRRTYVRASSIAFVDTEATKTVKRKKPALLLKAAAGAPFPLKVRISYLARGLSWAPSYKVDISDPKKLLLEQAAVVRNELTDLKDVEVFLISGFPSIQFGHVKSPLSAHATWSRFFAELGQDPQGRRGGQVMLAQQVASNAYFAREDFGGASVPDVPGDGIDLHYQSIGPRTLGLDSSLSLSVAKAEADYRRIVEWLIPDTRDAHGNQQRHQQGQNDDDDPWDALKFKNPFTFAMTSAPAFVTAKGRFGGQRLSTWVNAGEETLLRVNKALSIRTRAVETEAQRGDRGDSERNTVWIGGARYRQSTVDGEISFCNHRKEEITMQIRRRFSGELVKADASPKVSLREEGVWSVNRRNELQWELKLKPGEEKKLAYQYTVLVSF